MTPESVGVAGTSLVLGKHSGRHALATRCPHLGFELERRELDRAYRDFVLLADSHKSVNDVQIIELIANVRTVQSKTAPTHSRADQPPNPRDFESLPLFPAVHTEPTHLCENAPYFHR
jgi:isopropylmalate/homocitrate/citramalate synthase